MTAQVHEILKMNGKEYSLACTPEIPEDSDFIEIVSDDEKEQFVRGIIFSTACWRRYIGTWEIKDDRLFLVDIIGIFKKTQKELIFADWYSGTLKILKGELLKYIHMEFYSIYEEEIHIVIEKGFVQSIAIIDNRDKKELLNLKIWDWRKLE